MGALAWQASKPRNPARQQKPIDCLNALAGTAPLDDSTLIANASPPSGELYTAIYRRTFPKTERAPIVLDLGRMGACQN